RLDGHAATGMRYRYQEVAPISIPPRSAADRGRPRASAPRTDPAPAPATTAGSAKQASSTTAKLAIQPSPSACTSPATGMVAATAAAMSSTAARGEIARAGAVTPEA